MAGDAREEAFVPILAKEPQELPRARDDDLAHAFVGGDPGIVAALFIGGQRGSVRPREIGVLHVDDEEGGTLLGEVRIGGLGRSVVVNRPIGRLPGHSLVLRTAF
jgi:hypothetical protein